MMVPSKMYCAECGKAKFFVFGIKKDRLLLCESCGFVCNMDEFKEVDEEELIKEIKDLPRKDVT